MRLLDGDAGLEAAEGREPSVISIEHEWLIGRRAPDFDVGVRKREGCGHDADDLGRLIAGADDLADDVGIAVEAPFPQRFGDQCDIRGTRFVIGCDETAAQYRFDSPNRDQPRRYAGDPDAFGDIGARVRRVLRRVAHERFEGRVALVPFLETNGCDVRDRRVLPRLAHAHEPVGVGKWQRLEQYRVDDREHGAARTDPERERENHGERQSRRSREHAKRVADVPTQGVDRTLIMVPPPDC